MTKEEAEDRAMDIVLVSMTRGEIEDACKKRNIKITKNRGMMEKKLIEALVNEMLED